MFFQIYVRPTKKEFTEHLKNDICNYCDGEGDRLGEIYIVLFCAFLNCCEGFITTKAKGIAKTPKTIGTLTNNFTHVFQLGQNHITIRPTG